MSLISNFAIKTFGNISRLLLIPNTLQIVSSRSKAKKTSKSTSNAGNSKPKHRGWKKSDGSIVRVGTILASQITTRFHPGLNVGFGRNGNLFAIHPGKVVVTCERINPNWEHTWIQKNYGERKDQIIYKKYFNVIPEAQHTRFKLMDKI